jgi:hypothetical protein
MTAPWAPRPPHISPAVAAQFIELLTFAESRSPGAACSFLRGYCLALSVGTNPGAYSEQPAAEPMGVAIGRVKREG